MSKRQIRGQDVVRDIHAGMGDSGLMEKYGLSAKQLESILRKLLEADLISHMQLYERTTLSDSQITRAFVGSRGKIEAGLGKDPSSLTRS